MRLDDGIGLYAFRYKAATKRPMWECNLLGLKFMTWKTLLRRNGAELRPAEE
jgi:hypothetical protein